MTCWIGGIGLLGPGLPGWAEGEPVLAGTRAWEAAETMAPAPAILSATERRRTSPAVRLALAVAAEAAAGEDARALETVFASGNGDGGVVGSILEALHAPDGAISPTQFHNSVHNSAAGYWHIAMGSTAASVSLGGHDGSFAAGLLAAHAAVVARGARVLLVAYDMPMPAPLAALRPIGSAFATALVLAPERGAGARASLDLSYVDGPAPGSAPAEGLDGLAAANPAARALPLLRALAARRAAALHVPLLADAHLALRVAPC